MSLQGKIGIVTGASLGIGRECALEMARLGARVVVNYRSNPQEADRVVEEIRASGSDAIAVQADVADQSAVERMVDETVAHFGGLDLFVSNAAYSDRQNMVEADLEGFRRTVDVTMWGAFHGLNAAARKMVQQGRGGACVIVSSPHAVIPIPGAMAYNMAKAAIDHMARTAAIELAEHRIRVNIVHPGWIDTPGERKFYSEEDLQRGARGIPWRRLGRPEEIAKLVTFLLTPDCDYMTGSTVLMDGGISLKWGGKDEE